MMKISTYSFWCVRLLKSDNKPPQIPVISGGRYLSPIISKISRTIVTSHAVTCETQCPSSSFY